jgi:hypothetical protein
MTISLGTRTLSDHLLLQGLDEAPGVAWNSRRVITGRSIIQIGPMLQSGRELSLQSEGHLKQADLTAIKAMEAAGRPVALVHPRGTFTVLITAVELTPDQDYVNPSASGADPWYSGKINLQEV